MNNELILTNKSETITSMEVAHMINKEHKYLLRDIRRYLNQIDKINKEKSNQSKIAPVDFFIETTYIDSKNEIRPCYNITHKGCEFIANKLTGIKGTEFTAKYVNRFHELEENNTLNSLITTIKTISNTMLEIQATTNKRLEQIEKSLKLLEKSEKSPEKKYSRWKTNTFDKLNILRDYVNDHSNKKFTLSDIMHTVLNEMQDTYNIEFSDYIKDYMTENNLKEKPYDLDVVNYYKDIECIYDMTLNSIMNKLNLSYKFNKNIFDELAEKIPS